MLINLDSVSEESSIHVDAWRDAYKDKVTGIKDDSKRKNFERARDDLAEKGYVDSDGAMFWLLDNSDN